MERFAAAEAALREKGYDVLNPATMNARLADAPRGKMMALCRAELECCDAIYMMRGWEGSEGARQEYVWAHKMGIEVAVEGGDVPPEGGEA